MLPKPAALAPEAAGRAPATVEGPADLPAPPSKLPATPSSPSLPAVPSAPTAPAPAAAWPPVPASDAAREPSAVLAAAVPAAPETPPPAAPAGRAEPPLLAVPEGWPLAAAACCCHALSPPAVALPKLPAVPTVAGWAPGPDAPADWAAVVVRGAELAAEPAAVVAEAPPLALPPPTPPLSAMLPRAPPLLPPPAMAPAEAARACSMAAKWSNFAPAPRAVPLTPVLEAVLPPAAPPPGVPWSKRAGPEESPAWLPLAPSPDPASGCSESSSSKTPTSLLITPPRALQRSRCNRLGETARVEEGPALKGRPASCMSKLCTRRPCASRPPTW